VERACYLGQNLIIERYSAEGCLERWPDLAREVTGRDPDLIVTVAGGMALALGIASSRIPIAATIADPLKWGFVKPRSTGVQYYRC